MAVLRSCLAILALFCANSVYGQMDDEFLYGQFPEDFAWAVATASYQVEGAWNVDGKGESVWDKHAHAGLLRDNVTGDIAADTYHKFREDIELLKNLHVSHYRFSVAWTRILPDGTLGSLNDAGIAYYNELIDALLAANIEPMVTMHHWDFPQALEDVGGWTNSTIVDAFTVYADILFNNFGDRVKMWITHNEPWVVAVHGYESGEKAPGQTMKGYQAAHHLILSHGAAYRLYDAKYRETQQGMVGITLNHSPGYPLNPNSSADLEAVETSNQFTLGWFANPIIGSGDYPEVMKTQIGEKSAAQGFEESRLPSFTEEQITNLMGTADFLGYNMYTSNMLEHKVSNVSEVGYYPDFDVSSSQDPSWESSASFWLKVTPWAIRTGLDWIKENYNNLPVYITENGVSDDSGDIEDTWRVDYLRGYINNVLKAITLDGCNVKGYTVWSFLDNLEWMEGFAEKFGIYAVDFNHPNRTRTAKASAVFYRHTIQKNGFAEHDLDVYIPHEDDFLEGTFPEGFKWATASASYQIEGAWNEGGKGPSIWDTFAHEGGHIYNNDTGDVAADGYHHYIEDIKLMRSLRVTNYRFSIAWTRIYPQGWGTEPNAEGVAFYNNFIDALLKMGIEPLVTLYHWDLPQGLEDHGGWLNDTISDRYAAYADTCFELFGDRVKHWITLNEPWVCSYQGFEDGSYAPGVVSSGTNIYIAAHNLIKSHAKAYRIYDEKYRATQNGSVGITLNCDWWVPKNPNDPADWDAAERGMAFACGWFKHPIFKDGDYPPVMRQLIDEKSAAEGLTESRLPRFTEEEKAYISGSADFLGLNHYSSETAESHKCEPGETGYYCDQDLIADKDPSWKTSGSVWLRWNPIGLRRLLNFIKEEYNVPVYITENGVTDNNGTVNDQHRIDYYRLYINELMKAVNIDECDVRIYVAWALVDFFEWSSGFHEKFGFFHVPLDDPDRPRSPKDSAIWFRNMILDNGFPNKVIQHEDDFVNGTFPDNFVWSAATASYQIEGGYDEGGKGRSIWDTFSHTPGKIVNDATGDVACDSYHKYMDDVQILSDMQVGHYRFSIAWTRIMPSGYGAVNQEGIDYYNNLIDALIAANITPMVTLYHWDLPQAIEDLGGWPNRTTAELFEAYADVCFEAFGDRVKFWLTLNEPWCTSFLGYGNGEQAPGVQESGTTDYEAGHTLILAHARAYRLYHRKYVAEQQGQISVTLNCDFATPKDPNNVLDVEAADRRMNFHLGWFAHPIYVNGDYPPNMRYYIDAKSMAMGINESRLPTFTEEEKEMIIGTHDFFGLNTYTTVRSADVNDPAQGNYYNDMDVAGDFDDSWEMSASSWLRVVPWGIRGIVNFIKTNYGDMPIYVTENGVSDDTGTLNDTRRVNFYKHYLNELMKAIHYDGVDVRGYTAWSLMDNYEWARGYSERFGIHYVDFNDPNRTRTPKASALYYSELVAANGFPNGDE